MSLLFEEVVSRNDSRGKRLLAATVATSNSGLGAGELSCGIMPNARSKAHGRLSHGNRVSVV
jgi:hypothetical protein